jgi:hypothetical protein
MLSFVDNNEYSADDHKNGSVFISKLFELIKDKPLSDDEDLQSLSVKFLTDVKYRLGQRRIEKTGRETKGG